jgi:hypothetical protein
VRLARWRKRLLDAQVNLDARADEPAAAACRQRRGLGDLGQPQQIGVEAPRLSFAARRHGELDVVETYELHRVPRLSYAVAYGRIIAQNPPGHH